MGWGSDSCLDEWSMVYRNAPLFLNLFLGCSKVFENEVDLSAQEKVSCFLVSNLFQCFCQLFVAVDPAQECPQCRTGSKSGVVHAGQLRFGIYPHRTASLVLFHFYFILIDYYALKVQKISQIRKQKAPKYQAFYPKMKEKIRQFMMLYDNSRQLPTNHDSALLHHRIFVFVIRITTITESINNVSF
jgi:hypothetical protein